MGFRRQFRVAIILTVFMLSAVSQDAHAQVNGPSLRETLDFIKGKIAASNPTRTRSVGFSVGGRQEDQYEWHYKPLQFGGSVLDWQEVWSTRSEFDSTYHNLTVTETITIIQLNLKDISLSSIRVSNCPDMLQWSGTISGTCFSVAIQTYNSEKKIIARQISKISKTTGNLVKPSDTADYNERRTETDSALIRVPDEETANRVAKALKHAVTLVGGKKEPF